MAQHHPNRPGVSATVRAAVLAAAFMALASLVCAAPPAAADPPALDHPPSLPDRLRNRLEAAEATGQLSAAGVLVYSRRALPLFYLERGYLPAWLDPAGRPIDQAIDLIAAIRGAGLDGLRPVDYHLAEIDSLLVSASPPRAAATPEADLDEVTRRIDIDLLLTDAFMILGSHLLQGRVDPERLNAEWLANRRGGDFTLVLREALAAGDIRAALAAQRPQQAEYRHLRDALARLREIEFAGGWRPIPAGPTLRRGDRGPRVALLRERLRTSVDYGTAAEVIEGEVQLTSDEFTEALEQAVRRVQWRHGLRADGLVGAETLAELNVPLTERIRQVQVNLERWRWLPHDLGQRHIRVNVAGFLTEVFEDGEVVLELASIVGTQYRQTPSFSGRMTYLVFAPAWHVPPGIARRDQLPRIRRDPAGYLAGLGMTLLDRATNLPIDPVAVDWETLADTDFNRLYRLRQDPGPLNALGAVKFMFPNPYNVYIHDTPGRDLFARDERNFSSGCIRVENPLDLAEFLLDDDPRWTRQAIEAAAARTTETTVVLRRPLPVHLLWWTAWASPEGAIHFRRDVYRRDSLVWAGLQELPPSL